MEPVQSARFGPVTVYFGDKSGKYPDGNQVVVRGADAVVAFDTPLVANRLAATLQQADLVILGHVHEDHMAGLHLLPHTPVHVHEADLAAARSWEGLSRHYGYAQAVVDANGSGQLGDPRRRGRTGDRIYPFNHPESNRFSALPRRKKGQFLGASPRESKAFFGGGLLNAARIRHQLACAH